MRHRAASQVLLLGGLASAASGATIRGHLVDSNGLPVPSATVEVQRDHSADARSVQTDATGLFTVASLGPGTYVVKAQKDALAATSGPVSVTVSDTKTVDLILKPNAAAVEFSDNPSFVVAGVTDNTYMGAHGSDAGARSTEDLTRATASLETNEKPVTPADIASLRAACEREPANAALHHELAVAEEGSGDPVAAVHEYERAAQLDPTEQYLFDWGTELLVHGATGPAGQVFEKGARSFPASSRMRLGSAVALYSASAFSAAAEKLFEASDIKPADPIPYLFLSKIVSPEITNTDGYLARIKRFATLQPKNAWANYYFALTLLSKNRERAKGLLERALELEPKLGEAHLQLGIIQSEEGDSDAALKEFQKAVEVSPELQQAHYRLAAAYRKAGDSQRAAYETEVFRRLEQEAANQRDQQRAELQRFVVKLKRPQ